MAQFVKFEMPEETQNKLNEVLQKILKTGGKVKAGINEVTKMVERGTAKLVVMAEDVSPEELLMHVPLLCDSKKIPFAYVKTRELLGEVVGLKSKASSIAVVNLGKAEKDLEVLLKSIKELNK